MRILVTGGTGYIGSHAVVELVAASHDPVIIDNFSNSKRSTLDGIQKITGRSVSVIEADLRDRAQIDEAFTQAGPFEAVMHFAGLKAVGESAEQPLAYYDNNVTGTINLLNVMQQHQVHTLVFSSSATVYGSAANPPFAEDTPTSATNPYGWTKVHIEQVLHDLANAEPFWRIALLRYFNPVGAHPSGFIGEDPLDTPNNLMPIITKVASGTRNRVTIFGSDYDTLDGTGVRDYVHVVDLAIGHIAALNYLNTHSSTIRAWNLGTGRGTSVLQLMHAFERVSKRTIDFETVQRRAGDAVASYADPSRARSELGWVATRTVEDMCRDTWRRASANEAARSPDSI